MPNYTKPPVTPAWAESKVGVPADLIQPTDVEVQAGWPLSAVPPSRQRFNWILNWLANAVRYFMQRGLVDYDALETYAVGARIIGDDGKTYKSIQAANIGHTPSTSPTWWERWGYTNSELDAKYLPRDFKDSVRVVSTVNLALNGLPVVDGVQLVAGDRILLTAQATPAQNGIWAAAAGAWVRAADCDVGMLSAGTAVVITEGSANADTFWELTTNDPITVGVTALTWAVLNNPSSLTVAAGDARYMAIAAGLNFSSIVGAAITTIWTKATAAGKYVYITAAGATTQTLPLASTFSSGQAIVFFNNGAGTPTFARQGTDGVLGVAGGGTSFVLNTGEAVILTTDGVTWFCNFLNGATGLPPRTWQNVLGSRVAGTTYTNSTGRDIFISVWLAGAASASFSLTVAGVAVASYATNNTVNGANSALTVIVPAGATYSASSGYAMGGWAELR